MRALRPHAGPGPGSAASLLGLLLGLSLGLGSCGGAGTPETPPNVVLLVLDTVRADHLSVYGYERPTTPFLDGLAGRSERYERCYATAPWTLPSHASLFTGLFPYEHGAHAARAPGGKIHDFRPLAKEHVTLAEALAEEGYRTGAFVANTGYLKPDKGMAQGFEEYDVGRLPGAGMSAKAAEWLRGLEPDRPFFLFVNYMDAHRPYNVAPLPAERRAGLPEPPDRPSPELLDELYQLVFTTDDPPPAPLVQDVVDAYDLGVANADLAVEQLVGALEELGLLPNTVLVVTSDHGEYFGEHDLVEHSKDVYQEALWVPLIVHRPGEAAPRVVADALSLADVPRLVLRDFPEPLARRLGARLAPEGDRPPQAEIHFTRGKDLRQPWAQRFNRERAVLFEGRYKLIASTDGQNELYDLQNDPTESDNLFAAQPKLAQILGKRLRNLMAGARAPEGALVEPAELSEEEIEELKQLGYL